MATKSKFHTQDGIKTLGNAEVDGSLTVTGNFTVNGTQTIIDSTTSSITDSMIELASGNTTSDTLDVGIYGNYNDGLSGEGDVSEYTGLFRDASDSTWKLYDGLEVEPTTTVNTSGSGFTLADLKVGDLTATTLTATNSITGASITYPTTDGTNGQVIKTNGSGTLSFGNVSLDSLSDCTISASTPNATTNPPYAGAMWIEEDTGKVFVCTNATTDNNTWVTVGSVDGIVSTADSTAITIDSSENVLVGKTALNNDDTGVWIHPNGTSWFTSDGAYPIGINRKSSDGQVLVFTKDQATAGQINSLSGRMGIGSGDTGIFFDSTRDCISPFTMSGNDGRTDAIDLGRSNVQFKDLHLSGTAKVGSLDVTASIGAMVDFSSTYSYSPNRDWRFITNNFGSTNWGGFSLEKSTEQGGTPSVAMFGIDGAGNMGIGVGGSAGATQPAAKLDVGGTIRTSSGILFGTDTATANQLDDYEEGTWTPALQNVTTNSSSMYGIYTKIGNICHIHAKIAVTLASLPGANWGISGLPFTSLDASDSNQRAIITIGGDCVNLGGNAIGKAHFRTNGTSLQGVYLNSGTTAYWTYNAMDSSSFELNIHGHYTTT
jgi:hypothetical protein